MIGHEIVHSFDDSGSKFDYDESVRNWWAEKDLITFKQKASSIISQFNKFTLYGKPVNGNQTQGENIADLGGISASFSAFQQYIKDFPNKVANVCGFTPNQQFFIYFAQMWKYKETKESLENSLITAVHSPEEFRVDGSLSNLPAFYEAFDIKSGDRMFRIESERINIW